MSQLVKGPDLPPGERMRGRLEPRGANERHGVGATDRAGGWRGAGRPESAGGPPASRSRGDPGTSERSAWLPDQGRLF
jgi:hypothetical protein